MGSGMGDDKAEAERHALHDQWWSPPQAIAALAPMSQQDAIACMAEALYLGELSAIARKVSLVAFKGQDDAFYVLLPAVWLINVGDAARLWRAGQATLKIANGDGDATVFGVRLNPEQVLGLKPQMAMESTSAAPPEIAEPAIDADVTESGPPVSDAHLTAWGDLFKRVYGGTKQDTLRIAEASAKGMFPGKMVTRKRVRALFEARKPGRKSMPPSE